MKKSRRGHRAMPPEQIRDLCGRLVSQNAEAFDGGRFEVAYHSLAAAMHGAWDLRDAELLAEVKRLADEQGKWIDSNAPGRPLSSQSARLRGNDSIFTCLARQAGSMILNLKVNEQIERRRQAKPAWPS